MYPVAFRTVICSVEKVMEIDTHIGCAMSGLTSDGRTLVDHARVECQVRTGGDNLPKYSLLLHYSCIIMSYLSILSVNLRPTVWLCVVDA